MYTVVARLKRGVDLHTAASELHAINHGMFALWKTSYQDDKATWNMTDLEQFVVGDVKAVAGLALASVALVWLIACWNASNLLVARVTSRRRELAVRVALGASRGRVVRHLLAESALLAAGSLSIGLGIAWACIQLWRGVGADYFPRMQEASMDGRVALLLVALALTSGLIFGLVPALSGTGGPVVESLRSLSRSSTGSVAVRRLRLALVGTQFAVATPLLVGAGLLLASLTNCGRSTLASILATCSRGRSACRRRSTQRLPAPPRSGRRSSVVSGPFRESRSAPSPTAGHPMAPVTSTTSISRTRQRSRASRSRRRRGWLSRPAISTSSA